MAGINKGDQTRADPPPPPLKAVMASINKGDQTRAPPPPPLMLSWLVCKNGCGQVVHVQAARQPHHLPRVTV